MRIIINGEEKKFHEKEITVEMLCERLGLDVEKIAVEKSMEIIPKSEFKSCLLKNGDKLEIIELIGGG